LDSQKKKDWRPELDLDAEALTALDEARVLPHGPERTEAMKKAGSKCCRLAESTICEAGETREKLGTLLRRSIMIG